MSHALHMKGRHNIQATFRRNTITIDKNDINRWL